MTTERWKAVVGYEGLYEVSDLGCVRSLTYPTAQGRKVRSEPMIIKSRICRGEHYSVSLVDESGKARTRFIHSLVLEAFIGPRPEDMEGCHNDGNPANNCVSNLRWDTPQGNQADRLKHGRDMRGTKHPKAKLSDAQVLEIKRRRAAGEPGIKLAKEFGVSPGTIADFYTNRNRKWLEV